MFKPKQKTFRQTMVGAVVKAVATTAMVGAGFFVSSTLVGQQATMVAPEHGGSSVMENRPNAEGSPADLMDKHNCWSGEAPKDMEGQMPGHVVVAKGDTPVYGGSRLVGQALSQIFEGEDHGLTVYGFCR